MSETLTVLDRGKLINAYVINTYNTTIDLLKEMEIIKQRLDYAFNEFIGH